MPLTGDYLKELKSRAKESHVYTPHQLAGLEIADLLEDRKHKALYIKLAKDLGSGELLGIAKQVADTKGIKNRGAYFMAVIAELRAKAKRPRSEIYRSKPNAKSNGAKRTNS